VNKLSCKIVEFIQEHHVLALATVNEDKESSSCSVFYVFDEESISFVFASDEKTEHMQNISKNKKVSCSVHLETKEVGTIRGVQVKAEVSEGTKEDKKAYLKAFPYARVMPNLQVWNMSITSLKYTDNRLGFGKKELWERVSA
jgi:uncharacterized protein YhbP (UPF0306 family)